MYSVLSATPCAVSVSRQKRQILRDWEDLAKQHMSRPRPGEPFIFLVRRRNDNSLDWLWRSI